MGNRVQFGPQTGDNYIEHLKSKTKIPMQRNGKGSFLLNVDFVNGGSTSITVDSGAEESVCPKDWGSQFGIRPASRSLNLLNASGGHIMHHGERSIQVEAPF